MASRSTRPAVSPLAFFRSFARDPQLGNPDFRRFWASSVLSNFGGQITLLALPICAALLLHATPEQMSMLTAFGVLSEHLGVRGALIVVAAGAMVLSLVTLFVTKLQRIRA
jgi:hypothetical protein